MADERNLADMVRKPPPKPYTGRKRGRPLGVGAIGIPYRLPDGRPNPEYMREYHRRYRRLKKRITDLPDPQSGEEVVPEVKTESSPRDTKATRTGRTVRARVKGRPEPPPQDTTAQAGPPGTLTDRQLALWHLMRGRPRSAEDAETVLEPPHVYDQDAKLLPVTLKCVPESGIAYWTTTEGTQVQFIHYSACNKKNPRTEDGKKWLEAELIGYRGGIQGPRWLQEMEGRFDIRDTARVFPDFDARAPEIVRSPIDIRKEYEWPIYGCYDYGYHPGASAFLAVAWPHPELAILFDEIYVREMSIYEQHEVLSRKPYYDRLRMTYADPSIWTRTQQKGKLVTSLADIWQDEFHVPMHKGQNFPGSDSAFIHLLKSVLWLPGKIRFQITSNCTNTIKEMRGLAWDEGPKTGNQNRQPVERIANRNVHAFDALKYLFLEMWMGTGPQDIDAAYGSVDWEIEQMERMASGYKYVIGGFRR